MRSDVDARARTRAMDGGGRRWERSRRPEKVASAARRDARAREDATTSTRDDRTIEAKVTDARANVG